MLSFHLLLMLSLCEVFSSAVDMSTVQHVYVCESNAGIRAINQRRSQGLATVAQAIPNPF